jgi:hypothetical protein
VSKTPILDCMIRNATIVLGQYQSGEPEAALDSAGWTLEDLVFVLGLLKRLEHEDLLISDVERALFEHQLEQHATINTNHIKDWAAHPSGLGFYSAEYGVARRVVASARRK